MTTYTKTLYPHIRSEETLPKIYWQKVLFLFPANAILLFFTGFEHLRILSLCLATAAASDFLAKKIFRKKQTLYNGATFYSAFLLSILIPPLTPTLVVVLGVFVMIFFAREFFGGLGSYPFNLAAFGYLFLRVSFPEMMPPSWVGDDLMFYLLGAVFVGGGLFLQSRKLASLVDALLFLGVFLLAYFLGLFPKDLVLTGSFLFFVAFFLLNDTVTTPMTRSGKQIAYLATALVGYLFFHYLSFIDAIMAAILVVNAMNPWLDVATQPKPKRKKVK